MEPEEDEEVDEEKPTKTPKAKTAATKPKAKRVQPVSERGRSVGTEYYNHACYGDMPVGVPVVMNSQVYDVPTINSDSRINLKKQTSPD